MAFLANDILQLVAAQNLPDGQESKNIFYVRLDTLGAATQTQVGNELRSYIESIYDAINTEVSNAVTSGLIDMYRRNTVTSAWDKQTSRSNTVTNANPTNPVGNQSSGTNYAKTADARVTARKSIAGLADGLLLTNSWTVAAQNAMAAFGQRWINPLALPNITLTAGVWSQKNGNFVEFNGVGQVRIFEGSMDTRKP